RDCSSSIVRTESSEDDDPALLLTNGHCVAAVDRSIGRPAPGAAIVDRALPGTSVAITDEKGYRMTSAPVDRLMYATMTGTDIAVFRLGKSYAQLTAEGA
ncbi:hypothetical protein ABE10_02760, partial [Bacillus toyonensis]|nr:hypothetical protein [Bacillus toyonensis]